jgi:protein-tyrosine phosphatase
MKKALSKRTACASFPSQFRIAECPLPCPPLTNLVAALARELEAGRNVVIHCRQSVGRSGMIAAGVFTSAGIEPERAIDLVSAARRQTIPETAEQRSWILRLPATASLSL